MTVPTLLAAPTAPSLPTEPDLYAIHKALLAAGFVRTRTSPAYANDPNWVYQHEAREAQCTVITRASLPNPHRGIDPDDETAMLVVSKAIDALIRFTGDLHIECGPRNARERAYAQAFNA